MKNGTIIAVFREPIEIIASSSTTNYAFVIGLQPSPPGAGPPPHRHLGEDEVLTVIDGEFDFFDGESWGLSTEAKLSIPFAVAITVSGTSVNRRGEWCFTTNGGGLDEYFAGISSLRLPDDMESLQEIAY